MDVGVVVEGKYLDDGGREGKKKRKNRRWEGGGLSTWESGARP